MDHAAEIEHDRIQAVKHSQSRVQINHTEQSEFRNLPQIDSFESENLKQEFPQTPQINPKIRSGGVGDDKSYVISTQMDQFGTLLRSKAQGQDSRLMDSMGSRGFFSRPQQTLLSSMEFHSGIKEIQQKQSVVNILTETELPPSQLKLSNQQKSD